MNVLDSGNDVAFQTVLGIVTAVLERQVSSLRRTAVAEDNLGRLLGRAVILLCAVPSPFPHLVAIVCRT